MRVFCQELSIVCSCRKWTTVRFCKRWHSAFAESGPLRALVERGQLWILIFLHWANKTYCVLFTLLLTLFLPLDKLPSPLTVPVTKYKYISYSTLLNTEFIYFYQTTVQKGFYDFLALILILQYFIYNRDLQSNCERKSCFGLAYDTSDHVCLDPQNCLWSIFTVHYFKNILIIVMLVFPIWNM